MKFFIDITPELKELVGPCLPVQIEWPLIPRLGDYIDPDYLLNDLFNVDIVDIDLVNELIYDYGDLVVKRVTHDFKKSTDNYLDITVFIDFPNRK